MIIKTLKLLKKRLTKVLGLALIVKAACANIRVQKSPTGALDPSCHYRAHGRASLFTKRNESKGSLGVLEDLQSGRRFEPVPPLITG